jgi:hypothetical protein
MKQNEIVDLAELSQENYERIFNVYVDNNNLYYYNLLNSIQFPKNLSLTLFNSYAIEPGDTWPLISFKSYKTPNLWWVILLANNIINPLASINTGDVLLIPKEIVVKEILSQISK